MTGFFDLPGEIRNRIYTCAFPEQQILLRCSHPKKAVKSASGRFNEQPSKYSTQLYAASPHETGRQQLLLSAHILRVCRKVHDEVLPLLYISVALHFDSMKAINCFLNQASTQGVKQIPKLAITQSGYGEPLLTSNTDWKVRHDQKWISTCKRIAQAMTGLQHLKLCLQICDWPSQLNLGAKWAKPLSFLKGPKGLDQVDIYLHSVSFPEQRLEAAARMLERAMMSEQGRAQRQLEYSLLEIARIEKLQKSHKNRYVLKDTTNVAQTAPGDKEVKEPGIAKVLVIRMEDKATLPRKAASKTNRQDFHELVQSMRYHKTA